MSHYAIYDGEKVTYECTGLAQNCGVRNAILDDHPRPGRQEIKWDWFDGTRCAYVEPYLDYVKRIIRLERVDAYARFLLADDLAEVREQVTGAKALHEFGERTTRTTEKATETDL